MSIDIPPLAQRHPFLALEYAEGGDLRRHLWPPPDLATTLNWAQQLAAGLLALHTPDPELDRPAIVHRDLSPGNLLFHRGRLLLTDLGLAKALEEAGIAEAAERAATGSQPQPHVAAHSLVAGTPGYIAPERLRGAEATPAVDIYAAGVLLGQLCAGVGVGVGVGGGGLSRELAELIGACRAERPEERPTAGELAARLREVAVGMGVAPYDAELVPRTREGLAAVWSNRGATAAAVGQPEEALAAYDRALALNPQHADAWTGRGDALGGLRRYEASLAAYDRALALDPQNARAWTNRGDTLGVLGRYEEALGAFERALALDPQDADVWEVKALAYRGLGRKAEAAAAEARARQLRGR